MEYPTKPVHPDWDGPPFDGDYDPRMYPDGHVHDETGYDNHRFGNEDGSVMPDHNPLFDSRHDEDVDDYHDRIEAELRDPGGGQRAWEQPGKSAALKAEGSEIMKNYTDAVGIFNARTHEEESRGRWLEPKRSQLGAVSDHTQDFIHGIWTNAQQRRYRSKDVLEPINKAENYHRHRMLFDALRKAREDEATAAAEYAEDVKYDGGNLEEMKRDRAVKRQAQRERLKKIGAEARATEFHRLDEAIARRDRMAKRTRERQRQEREQCERLAKLKLEQEDQERVLAADDGIRVTRSTSKRSSSKVSSKIVYL
jgi:hypothetical protein